MSNVTLAIGGRSYTVACATGEEDHVRMLGGMIADKVQAMAGTAHNEARQLLFAALLLADELHEARHRGGASSNHGADPDAHAPALEALASRLEKIAAHLEA